MRLLPFGDRALLVELADTDAVVAWVDGLRRSMPPGVADLVPAARTVLVVSAAGADLAELGSALRAVEPVENAADSQEAEEIEIPVRYDGPDLAEVAELTGLSVAEVVAA